MPLTQAERAKRYREKFKKKNNPEAYEERRKRHAEMAKKLYKKKKNDKMKKNEMTEKLKKEKTQDHCRELRLKHRTRCRIQTSDSQHELPRSLSGNSLHDEPVTAATTIKATKRYNKLHGEILQLKKGYNNLLKKFENQQQQLSEMNKKLNLVTNGIPVENEANQSPEIIFELVLLLIFN